MKIFSSVEAHVLSNSIESFNKSEYLFELEDFLSILEYEEDRSGGLFNCKTALDKSWVDLSSELNTQIIPIKVIKINKLK